MAVIISGGSAGAGAEKHDILVGDIIRSLSVGGANWVPADGRTVDKTVFPELYDLLPYRPQTFYVESPKKSITGISTSGVYTRLHFLKKLNGFYVGMVNGTLIYRYTGATNWTKRDITSTVLGSHYRIGYADMIYDDTNGQYLLAAQVGSSSGSATGYAKLFSLPTISGTISQVFANSNVGSGACPVILSKIGTDYFYRDSSYDNAQAMNNKSKMYHATNPTGTWTEIKGSDFGMNYSVNCVKKINNRWFIGSSLVSGSTVYPAVAISEENQSFASATWTIRTMPNGIATSQNPSRYRFVNNVVYMPQSGAYLFVVGEEDDEEDEGYYTVDLFPTTGTPTFTAFPTTTQAAPRVGGMWYHPRIVDGILYTASGAYRDIPGNTGNPLTYKFSYNYPMDIDMPHLMTDDGLYVKFQSDSTTAVDVYTCEKCVPYIEPQNGMVYKIKAAEEG